MCVEYEQNRTGVQKICSGNKLLTDGRSDSRAARHHYIIPLSHPALSNPSQTKVRRGEKGSFEGQEYFAHSSVLKVGQSSVLLKGKTTHPRDAPCKI